MYILVESLVVVVVLWGCRSLAVALLLWRKGAVRGIIPWEEEEARSYMARRGRNSIPQCPLLVEPLGSCSQEAAYGIESIGLLGQSLISKGEILLSVLVLMSGVPRRLPAYRERRGLFQSYIYTSS